jgi:hypothetical protein
MKKLLVLTLALVTLAASLARAQGTIRLTYSNCNLGGNLERFYPCNVDPPQTPLICSFVLNSALSDFVGVDAYIDLWIFGSSNIPDWWSTAPGECREGLVAAANVAALSGCSNAYAATAGQGGGLDPNQADPLARSNHRQWHVAWARSEAIPLAASIRYSACRLNIEGTGAEVCPGCQSSAVLHLVQIKVYGQGGTILNLTSADLGGTVTWGAPIDAVQTKTWGAVKSLYR